MLEKAARAGILSETEERLFFRGLHIVGGGRRTQAFAPLMRFLHRPIDEIDALIGAVKHFGAMLAEAKAAPNDAGRFEKANLGYVSDTLAELERWPINEGGGSLEDIDLLQFFVIRSLLLAHPQHAGSVGSISPFLKPAKG